MADPICPACNQPVVPRDAYRVAVLRGDCTATMLDEALARVPVTDPAYDVVLVHKVPCRDRFIAQERAKRGGAA